MLPQKYIAQVDWPNITDVPLLLTLVRFKFSMVSATRYLTDSWYLLVGVYVHVNDI